MKTPEEGTYLAVVYKQSEYDRYADYGDYEESMFCTIVANDIIELAVNDIVRQAVMSLTDRTWLPYEVRLFRSSFETGKLRRIMPEESDFKDLVKFCQQETTRIIEAEEKRKAEVARLAYEEAARRAVKAKRQAEANEKAEYERLKKKFEGK